MLIYVTIPKCWLGNQYFCYDVTLSSYTGAYLYPPGYIFYLGGFLTFIHSFIIVVNKQTNTYHLTTLSIQFSTIRYIHTVAGPLPSSIDKNSFICKTETLYPLNNDYPSPPLPSFWQLPFYFTSL